MNTKDPEIAIIGWGKFGKTLYRLLKDDFSVTVLSRNPEKHREENEDKKITITSDIQSVFKKCAVLFYSVPIKSFEIILKNHVRYINKHHLIINVFSCNSVKEYVEQVIKKTLKNNIPTMLIHPMFEIHNDMSGLKGLTIIMNQFTAPSDTFHFWKLFFSSKGLYVVVMSPTEHDRLAAKNQGVVHFMGRILERLPFSPTPIDTLSAKKLHELMNQTCQDTWELFLDLQQYNRFTRHTRNRIGKSYKFLFNRLLPKRLNTKKIIFGIQGGKGSFNEQALLTYTTKHSITAFQTKYLFTADRVLKKLHEGTIDFGLFAIHNAQGGIVWESARAIARYTFAIIEEFGIEIRHTLMKRKDVAINEITTIIAHPQVFLQCKKNLKKNWNHLIQISGKGNMIDTAKSAEAISEGKLPKTYAVLGPKKLAELFDFDIIAENLQDLEKNITHFFLVSR